MRGGGFIIDSRRIADRVDHRVWMVHECAERGSRSRKLAADGGKTIASLRHADSNPKIHDST